MPKRIEIVLSPEEAASEASQNRAAARKAGIPEQQVSRVILRKRSVDARSRHPVIRLQVDVYSHDESPELVPFERPFRNVASGDPVLIVGAGPAGLFAALRLIEEGLKPVIVERGKSVQERRRDLARLNKERIIDPDSNYCFGEGGAGTYSDGKLFTRSDKRGDVSRVLSTFILFGANPDIAIDAHPHIGTNKLPGIIEAMRECIAAHGGEVHFGHRFRELSLKNGSVAGLLCDATDGSGTSVRFDAKAVILATGHSARDVFSVLHEQQIEMHAKPFALGVRVEHPQEVIDRLQYHCDTRSSFLPPAPYTLSAQVSGKGVYSFCMCPGGIIAAAATSPGEVVVNGWSPSKRNNPYANSGLVVSVDESDFGIMPGPESLRALRYQESVERMAFIAGGKSLAAPAQKVNDFINNRISSSLPSCSYIPGITSVDLRAVLPAKIHEALREGLVHFGKKMPGYLINEAVLVATESRTSSPVRIPRDSDSLMHHQLPGFFPCGEGAGYAGGIMSAAIDGERVASAVTRYCNT